MTPTWGSFLKPHAIAAGFLVLDELEIIRRQAKWF